MDGPTSLHRIQLVFYSPTELTNLLESGSCHSILSGLRNTSVHGIRNFGSVIQVHLTLCSNIP